MTEQEPSDDRPRVTHGAQSLSRYTNHRREYLVKHGKASRWLPYTSPKEAIRRAGIISFVYGFCIAFVLYIVIGSGPLA